MSFDDDEYIFYDLESPDLLVGFDSSDNNTRSSKEAIRLMRSEAIKAISHLTSIYIISNKLIKNLLNNDLSMMVYRYGKVEKLPNECISLAQQPNALPPLLKGFLKKLLRRPLTPEKINEIDSFCEVTYRNDQLDIVYDRVALVQRFIHGMADNMYGEGFHQSLPKQVMKNLLSTARLHLNLVDIKYKDAHSLSLMFSRSKSASDNEIQNPQPIKLPKGKKYIKNWRTIHLMPLVEYQTGETDRKIHAIFSIDKNQNIEDFKSEAIKIYCGENLTGELGEWTQGLRWKHPDPNYN